ncbi:hypothetical protein ID866_7960 [Astraeus odoratus]|nr:hypothetical protein ID866_7960 [Astraeus odoratus]
MQRHPTPHEIFHLPLDASQAQIKARYYELVKFHHPDSLHARHLPSSERTKRFQAFQHAYKILQRPRSHRTGKHDDFIYAEVVRRRRHEMRSRSQDSMGAHINEETRAQASMIFSWFGGTSAEN